jgi:hypothetical protein
MWRRVDLMWTDVSEKYRLHLQGRKIREWDWKLQPPFHIGFRSRFFLPWRWRAYFPPKRRFTQDLHGSTTQKKAFFMKLLNWESRHFDIWWRGSTAPHTHFNLARHCILGESTTGTWEVFQFVLRTVRFFLSIYLSIYGSAALCWTLDAFSVY